MQYRIDFHCHSRFSADGVSEPEALVRVAKEKGLNGFALTDHNTSAGIDYLEQIGLIRKDGLPVDNFLILPGQEITTKEGHLLALGIKLPDLKGIPAIDAVSLIHSMGGLAIAPHPFDYFRAGIRKRFLDKLPLDGIEVFNAAVTFKRCNQKAMAYAKERRLPMISASDAHDAEVIGTALTIVETDDFSVQGILRAIRHGTLLEKRYISTKEALKKTWNNVFRFRSRHLMTKSIGNDM
ncbi:metal-dependent phosphoesterase [Methylacidiphilum kamchatkense Kam1]|uniref:Metal-dependent phosphoesterase n=1 Tax=Methylacidiphilum kamchatkense Kam1 TaxID=1202785 RepID=A0A0C1RIQ4_9BACT|nr:PHP domain-containing protein [Methylacidiphilum kamchatkense]KIE57932.1 metal-dependent phosphoesterase [Methylacidiphilum kamchatkense Kam1]QDQ42359.1 hypothetical protein kam1_1130 [Methylacidiphilum kamchatkense Kam1]